MKSCVIGIFLGHAGFEPKLLHDRGNGILTTRDALLSQLLICPRAAVDPSAGFKYAGNKRRKLASAFLLLIHGPLLIGVKTTSGYTIDAAQKPYPEPCFVLIYELEDPSFIRELNSIVFLKDRSQS